MFTYEEQLLAKGIRYVAGIDEVGRGCLAGPMVIGCVVYDIAKLLNLKHTTDFLWINDIKDSKKLTPRKRNELNDKISSLVQAQSVFEISNRDIDEHGISWAQKYGFTQVLERVGDYNFVLTDAFAIPTIPISSQLNIVGGDNVSTTIASASIVAKVYRDKLMVSQSLKYPMYHFDKHKGYGTKVHIETIKAHGICDIHRQSYEPIKSMLGN